MGDDRLRQRDARTGPADRGAPFETVAGLVNYHTGRLETEGERVELDDVTITVLDTTERRVRRVRIDWVPASGIGEQSEAELDSRESNAESENGESDGRTGSRD